MIQFVRMTRQIMIT